MKATLLCAFFAVFLATSCVFGKPVNNVRGLGGGMGGKEMMYEFDGEMGDDGMMYDYDGIWTAGQMGDRNVGKCKKWCWTTWQRWWRLQICCQRI
ncbi:hypothetical protein DPMN_127236 [Dreissena polymorpha]|uniref:Uncharacterized protein n=1 Tax=Dreissena polymorpha TaxID=45954 RepID=A0A9D4GXA6_DREPO|nr:hypothetical protein DPMN_127236 [Dreissena polymorpha]